MGCSGSIAAAPRTPPVVLAPLPANLQATPAGAKPINPPATSDTQRKMMCPSCEKAMNFYIAPVISCPSCNNKCLPPARQGDFTFQVQVPVEAGTGSGSPFGVPLSTFKPLDKRVVLIVPPVELPSSTTLTVAVGPEFREGDFGDHFDLEGIVIKINLPAAGVTTPGTPQRTQDVQGGAKSSGGLLQGLAGAAASVAVAAASSVSSAANSQLAALAGRPKTLVMRSNVHYMGPLALGQPVSGVGASMATALGSAFPCGACGTIIKCSAKCRIFRCGNCGVLSALPVLGKETVLHAQLTSQAPEIIVTTPETLPNPQDPLRPRQRRVLVRWPVTNMSDTAVTIAVPPYESSFSEMFGYAFGVAFDTLHWVTNPLEAAFDTLVLSPAAGPVVDSMREPDGEARIIGTQ